MISKPIFRQTINFLFILLTFYSVKLYYSHNRSAMLVQRTFDPFKVSLTQVIYAEIRINIQLNNVVRFIETVLQTNLSEYSVSIVN